MPLKKIQNIKEANQNRVILNFCYFNRKQFYMALAIIGAAIRSFTQFSTARAYEDACFDMLTAPPPTHEKRYVRMNIAHIINKLCHWPSLQHFSRVQEDRKKMKDFYVNCMRLLIASVTLDEFKTHLYNIFIVALSANDGHHGGKTVASEVAKIELGEAIGTVGRTEQNDMNRFEQILALSEIQQCRKQAKKHGLQTFCALEQVQKECASRKPSKFRNWVFGILKSAADTIVAEGSEGRHGNRDNIMLDFAFVIRLVSFCDHAPMWSGSLRFIIWVDFYHSFQCSN